MTIGNQSRNKAEQWLSREGATKCRAAPQSGTAAAWGRVYRAALSYGAAVEASNCREPDQTGARERKLDESGREASRRAATARVSVARSCTSVNPCRGVARRLLPRLTSAGRARTGSNRRDYSWPGSRIFDRRASLSTLTLVKCRDFADTIMP